jgi:ferredoxin
MKRAIIRIDEEKCNGCGLCVPNCHEGALQIIDEKARLISDLFCDGLGACLGHCPEGAITIEEREAEPYDERKVMELIVPKGRNTILAHLEHLRDHNEEVFLAEAIRYLKENNVDLSPTKASSGNGEHPMFADLASARKEATGGHHGCPGSAARDFRVDADLVEASVKKEVSVPTAVPSALRQWPVQLHLLNPQASYFKQADVVLAADCAAFAMGDFHSRFLQGRSIAIACPKLDSNKESYLQKLTSMISDAKIKSLAVVIMEVPCCGGLLHMAQMARENAGVQIPIRVSTISVTGEVLQEEAV